MSRLVPVAFKQCACGVGYSSEQWDALKTVGVQESNDESGFYRCVLKNCTCGSTIGVESGPFEISLDEEARRADYEHDFGRSENINEVLPDPWGVL